MCVVVNLNVRKQLWPVPVSVLGRHIVHGFKRKTRGSTTLTLADTVVFENEAYLHNLHFAA